MAESSDTPLTMQNLKQLLDGVMTTQEARLQSQWKDQFQTFMASMEAKWKANTEKAKAAQQPEMPATTPLSNRQALFRGNPGLPIATDEGSSDGAPMVQKHSNPQQWIFNIQEYFDFHQTVELQRLQIAGFCLEGDAFEWFRWMKRNRLIFGWHDFLEKVEQRFGTTHFEDPLVELAKLTQIGTVADFQAAFEKLLNRVTGVTETQLVSYVIGGLKSHLRRELLLYRPRTILAAFELAKAHEARHNELMLECRTANNEKPRPPVIHENIRWQPRGSKFSQVTIRPSANSQPNALPPGKTKAREFLPAPMAQPTPALPIRKYTTAEIREKRDKGLCFRCDQKYFSGHYCKGRFLLLIGDEDDETVEGDPVVVEDYHTDEERKHPQLYNSSYRRELQLPTKSIKPFQVYIGNGDTLGCQHVCPGVEVCMQGLTFAVHLHVLRIVGPGVVLGVQWLQSLGSVTHDYSKITMEFHMGSTIVTLKGDSGLSNQPISFNQLQAMVTNGAIQTLYEIHHINTTNSTEPAQIQPTLPPFPEPLQDLLLEFSAIFEPPKTLPPHRVFDHKIHLLPNSKPVNVRPYRYPYFQKSEIEKLVREMLD
nr:Transposon Ty3-G Gag-Pol polyprotein [Ipomoea batatas]